MIYTYIYHFRKSHHCDDARSPYIVSSLLLARDNNWINDWLLSNLEWLFFLRAAQRLRVFDICWRGKCIYLREMKRVYHWNGGRDSKNKESNEPQPFIPKTLPSISVSSLFLEFLSYSVGWLWVFKLHVRTPTADFTNREQPCSSPQRGLKALHLCCNNWLEQKWAAGSWSRKQHHLKRAISGMGLHFVSLWTLQYYEKNANTQKQVWWLSACWTVWTQAKK